MSIFPAEMTETKADSSLFPFRCMHDVSSYELDSFGHVNNAVYMNYLEKARNEFLRQRGLLFHDFFKWGKFPVVSRAELKFRQPAKSDDKLMIQGRVMDSSVTSFRLGYEVRRIDSGLLILEAETVHVFVDGRGRPVKIPEIFREKFLIPDIEK